MKICPKCQKKHVDADAFCRADGNPLIVLVEVGEGSASVRRETTGSSFGSDEHTPITFVARTKPEEEEEIPTDVVSLSREVSTLRPLEQAELLEKLGLESDEPAGSARASSSWLSKLSFREEARTPVGAPEGAGESSEEKPTTPNALLIQTRSFAAERRSLPQASPVASEETFGTVSGIIETTKKASTGEEEPLEVSQPSVTIELKSVEELKSVLAAVPANRPLHSALATLPPRPSVSDGAVEGKPPRLSDARKAAPESSERLPAPPPSVPPAVPSAVRAVGTADKKATTKMAAVSAPSPSAPPAVPSAVRAVGTADKKATTKMAAVSAPSPSAPPAVPAGAGGPALDEDHAAIKVPPPLPASNKASAPPAPPPVEDWDSMEEAVRPGVAADGAVRAGQPLAGQKTELVDFGKREAAALLRDLRGRTWKLIAAGVAGVGVLVLLAILVLRRDAPPPVPQLTGSPQDTQPVVSRSDTGPTVPRAAGRQLPPDAAGSAGGADAGATALSKRDVPRGIPAAGGAAVAPAPPPKRQPPPRVAQPAGSPRGQVPRRPAGRPAPAKKKGTSKSMLKVTIDPFAE